MHPAKPLYTPCAVHPLYNPVCSLYRKCKGGLFTQPALPLLLDTLERPALPLLLDILEQPALPLLLDTLERPVPP